MGTQIQGIEGYPVAIFYLAALIGVVLVLVRPRWAFFYVVFCLSARHFHMAVFTRSPLLGEYMNLNDLFLWIGVLATLRIAFQGEKMWLPPILLAIIAINLLGGFQSFIQYGFKNFVLQSFWANLIFPILFLVAVNIVRNSKDARIFYWTLFIGAACAALQHLFFMQEEMSYKVAAFTMGGLRTISYSMSGGLFLVISAFFIDMRNIIKNFHQYIFWLIGIPLIAMSYILSFTRTIWLGAIMAGCALFLLFLRERRNVIPRLGYLVVLSLILILAFKVTNKFFLPGVDVAESIDERADFARYDDAFERAFQTRESGMETELKLWKNGTIIWGVGSCYPPALAESTIEITGALGHVAFSTYLAHFGLIGLFVYGLLLPYLTIMSGKRYYLQHTHDYGGIIAITAMALALYDVSTLLSSTHYLSSTTQVNAMIYGAFWGQLRFLEIGSVGLLPKKG